MGAAPSTPAVAEVVTIVDSGTRLTTGCACSGGGPGPAIGLAPDSFTAAEYLGKHAPYIVALHQHDNIRMIGLYSAESARAVYDAISKAQAKVIYYKEHHQVLASYGSDRFVKLCEDRISQMNAFNSTTTLQYAPYVVALHKGDHVQMIGFSKEEHARAVYNVISNEWAKILMDRRRAQDLLSHGGDRWIRQCKEEVLRLSPFEIAMSPSPSGPYIVAFHRNDCVRMIGLSTEESARTVYDAISREWAKILMDKRRRSALLASSGLGQYIAQCEEEIRGLDVLQSTSLQTASYIVAFHRTNHVRMLGFSEERVAREIYDAVSDELAKVLMHRRNSEPRTASYFMSGNAKTRSFGCSDLTATELNFDRSCPSIIRSFE